MKILAIGDVVGPLGLEYLQANLRRFISENNIDLTVVNGENVSVGNGLSSTDAKAIRESGADIITSGNHIWKKKDIYDYLDSSAHIVRPCNYPAENPGMGYTCLNIGGYRILAINVMGTVFTAPLNNPIESVEKILCREEGNYDIAILDIHAEATSEKLAMGKYFDGRINVIFGTHTHIQTADLQIFPKGTGYITDLGMTGSHDGVLGVKTECIIYKLTKNMPVRFELSQGDVRSDGAIFELDDSSGKCIKAHRIASLQ